MPNQGIARLPFVRAGKDGVNFWATAEETGKWEEDNRIGRHYADALVSVCSDGTLGMSLSRITEAVVKQGRYGGIEVGFFNRLGEIASYAVCRAAEEPMRATG